MIGIIYAIVIFHRNLFGRLCRPGRRRYYKTCIGFYWCAFMILLQYHFYRHPQSLRCRCNSTFKQIRNKVKFDFIMILLISVGAIVGGNVGSTLFNSMLSIMDEGLPKAIQAILLAGLLIIVLVTMNGNFKTYHIKNKLVMLIIGLVLGTLSSFLGIGGGPINVAVFVFFFSIEMETATVYSYRDDLIFTGIEIIYDCDDQRFRHL